MSSDQDFTALVVVLGFYCLLLFSILYLMVCLLLFIIFLFLFLRIKIDRS